MHVTKFLMALALSLHSPNSDNLLDHPIQSIRSLVHFGTARYSHAVKAQGNPIPLGPTAQITRTADEDKRSIRVEELEVILKARDGLLSRPFFQKFRTHNTYVRSNRSVMKKAPSGMLWN